MSRLQTLWAMFFLAGFILMALDMVAYGLINIEGVPAVGVLGGALFPAGPQLRAELGFQGSLGKAQTGRRPG